MCPACALAFDWSEAVPIEHLTCAQCGYHLYGLSETRCPECGQAFDWSEVLKRFYRTRLPYFEYRWRDRPVRSFFATWRRVLRPSRFWRKINLHDPPRPLALLLTVGICVMLFAGTIVLGATLLEVYWNIRYWFYWVPGRGTPMTLSWFAGAALQCFLDFMQSDAVWIGTLLFGVWLITSLVSLLIFQQSMRLRRIRTAQVVRVWAYSVSMIPPLFLIFGFAGAFIEALVKGWPSSASIFVTCGLLVLDLHVLWSLRCAYRHYLGMPHAGAIAICSQVVAIPGAVVLIDALSPSGVFIKIVYVVGEWMGEW